MIIYNKLVRDKTPQIIKGSGKKSHIRYADKDERLMLLENKLSEEINEFKEDRNLEELADIMKVLFGLAKALGHSEGELIAKRNEKRDKRGGFDTGIVLLSVKEK